METYKERLKRLNDGVPNEAILTLTNSIKNFFINTELEVACRKRLWSLLIIGIYAVIGSLQLVIKNNLKKINLSLFVSYLKQFPVISIRRRAGYLLEKAGCSATRLRELRKSIGGGKTYVALDPSGPRSGKINKDWGIIVNR